MKRKLPGAALAKSINNIKKYQIINFRNGIPLFEVLNPTFR